MNILLWVLQVVLAWLCIAGGYFQIFKIGQLQKGVASMRELPRGVWAFFGIIGCLTGLGLVLPGVIGMLPILVPISAAVVAVESVVISAIYLYFGDRSPVVYTVVMAILAAFVAYGRFVSSPL